ncbi:MAG: glucoamylase family protein, partial [Gemmatimonadota bacterium]
FEAAIELTLTRIKEYPGTGSAGSGNRPVLTSVLEMLAKARAAAQEGSTSTSPPAALLSLSTILGRISVALRGVPHHSPASPPLSEWVDWSLDLIEQHLRRLNNLVSLTVPGRNGERRVVFPALRDLPATGEPALTDRLQAIADRSFDYAWETDFRFLYDKNRKLFSIGYQQDSHSLDSSYYDLLASEARLASFLAIAKNDVPVEHWFRLGRTLTRATGQTALVSWSGSMFEYLMPTLVMQSFPYTVLDQTYRGAVARQIAYGAERGVPWGVSESAYNVRDRHLTYQYRAFGVPDLALKRGLGRDLVIAPYATALAVMIEPQRALANLAALERRGALGPYGFRDSLDYTRPDPGQRYAIVATYMAHHVAMALVALANALGGQEWQRRFHADPMVRATELLLHERIPRRILLQEVQMVRAEDALPDPELARPAVREIDNPDTAQPHVALLGLPPYTIMISHAGAGYSRYENLAVTRWRADGTRDHTGQFCYLKDLTDGRTWSAAHQPVCAPADWYRALLATDRVTFHRADGPIETRMEIAVVPADAAEVRRITVTNTSDEPREIEVTSYGEIVLAPPDSDRSHPAFSNLFVETEWHQWCTAITATRRPRATGEPVLWCAHVVAGAEQVVGPISCETDRARFLGRGRTPREPQVMESDGPLSGTTGAVLDPIFAIRARVKLGRSQSVTIAFTTLVATTRDRALELAGRYHDTHASQRALDLAWTTTQVELRELNISPAETAVFQEIAGHLFHGHPQLRAPQSELVQNRGSQPLLWSTGLSGDWPILLATISAASGLPTLRQLFAAHHYWRRRGMMVDLVIINAQPHSYQQELNDKITEALYASNDSGFADKPGGVFIRRKDLLRAEELLMLRATARVHIACDGRPLGRIVDAMLEVEETPAGVAVEPPPQLPRMPGRNPAAAAARAIWRLWSDTPREKPLDQTRALRPSRPSGASRVSDPWDVSDNPLTFDNGIGGIGPDGGYQIRVQGERMPPAPWVNIIANPFGGFIVSERGSGCCWAVTSQSFRLTPWANDPVSDPPGEVIYLQDAESGELWSPTPAPFIHDAPYRVNHQAGKSTFVHEYGGIGSHLTMGLAEDETTVKIGVLRLTNRTDRPRAIIVTSYVEWTLGILREHTRHQIQTTFDVDRQAILAQNFFDPAFAESVAFSAMSEPITSWTADRRDFLGRNGAVTDPVALLHGVPLSGFSGAGVDPCAALQCVVDVAPGETREIVILLGAAATGTKAGEALDRYRAGAAAMTAAETTAANWDHRLSVITAHTPEPSFDAMVNRWTLYQALACRMWGRTALYQSSGAYGFRDQLQDSCAFVYAEQQVAREHIIRSAGRQFVEGDVQHWWHPHNGRGVRTRFSDDLIWLPFVVEQYTRVTGDTGILDAQAPYLTMRQLEPHEHEVYDIPDLSNESGSVYEHCVRALRRGATTGEHGLPLIGSGDWNDGMNRVGIEGKGESVWLAWFLIVTLRNFAELADARGEADTAGEFRKLADDYAAAVDAHAWDGEWYRRAYFDDGTPLGSAGRAECRIDSIAQSWSVISGAGTPEHQVRAMKSLDEQLVRPDARLIMLLTPAFDKTPEDPGYIKGYLPGVRENGAQYTHAALWAVLATAMQGKGDHAFDLYQMINPLTHTATPDEVARYMTEPYVVAADVYTADGHLGRGGWTWYTGSASWMYRVGLEAILGFHKNGNTLTIKPCVP